MSVKDKLKWNEKYTEQLKKEDQEEEKEYEISQPNERLTMFKHYFQGNKALDLACGLGANSYYLAQNGYQVTAVDISDVAIQQVNKLAMYKGLSVQGQVVDLEDSSLPREEFDLLVNTFYLERSLFIPMEKALQPNGYLFIETYYQVQEEDPNPNMNKKYKLTSQELLHCFNKMKIIYYHENKKTGLATLFAQKM